MTLPPATPFQARLSPSTLPFDESIVFEDSSFFTQINAPSTLPSPEHVRVAADVNDSRHSDPNRPDLVQFPSLNLIVKYGPTVTIAEGQCLWAIRRSLPDLVPVPEVYGWCRDGGDVFIYMQLVRGVTLEKQWDTLSKQGKDEVCKQLQHIVGALHCLEQDVEEPFIGHIGRQPLLDIIFVSSCSPAAGPFPSVQSFHDYFCHLPHPYNRASGEPPHPMRQHLSDNVPIIFTHGDLHPSNIILSPDGDGAPRVVAIIDWHQSGWYPEYWESCKARWTARIGEEWETEYLPRFLKPFGSYDYWDFFVLRLGV